MYHFNSPDFCRFFCLCAVRSFWWIVFIEVREQFDRRIRLRSRGGVQILQPPNPPLPRTVHIDGGQTNIVVDQVTVVDQKT